MAGLLGAVGRVRPSRNLVVTPSYIRCAPSLACGRLWQWSIQIPGLSATNATSIVCPVDLERVGPPRASRRLHTIAGEHDAGGRAGASGASRPSGCRCATTTSPSETMNIGTAGNICPLTVHWTPGRPVQEAGSPADAVVEPPVRAGRVERQRRGRAIAQQVDGLARRPGGRPRPASGSEHQRGPAHLHPHRLAVACISGGQLKGEFGVSSGT